MITKMNYLLLSTVMIAAIDSTFCRGCDCCKKLCADKDNNESFPNSENNNTNLEDEVIKMNENAMPNNNNDNTHDNFLENSKKKETLYFAKIDKAGQDDGIKKCFNGSWYKACQDKVLLLKQVNDDDKDLLKVTGSDNEWEITDSLEKVLENANCNPNNNKWIIVKVTTWDENSEGDGDSFIFYVDDITSIAGEDRPYGVFDNIKCYSIEIIAANTSAVQNMHGMFYFVESALEKEMEEDIVPGLVGLDKLNVENVTSMSFMFTMAIHKQATLEQLKKWRFSGENKVDIRCLFASKVEGLNFRVLDGWSSATKNGTVSFSQWVSSPETVFISNKKYKFTAPRWYDSIKNSK